MVRTIGRATNGSEDAPAADRASNLDPQVDALWSELHPIIAGERSAFAQRCHQLSVSMPHLHVMTALDTQGPMTMGAIAEALGAALPNVTGLVSRMQERGVVERLRNEADRREVLVSLTPAGRDKLRSLELIRRRRLGLALAQMSAEHRKRLLESIHHLRVAFETASATKEII